MSLRTSSRVLSRSGLLVAAQLAVSSCAIEPYCLECDDSLLDGGGGDAMDASRDALGRDTLFADVPDDVVILPDGCAPGAPELCNAFDDDCDLMIDEGIDTSTDLDNCGGCGRRCAPPNAFAECTGGTCDLTTCGAGYYDRDGDPANGCEVRCITTEPVEMTCNRRDDDCDGMTDETFDLRLDPTNCGTCGRICRSPHASSSCTAGSCTLGTCEPGFIDLDGLESNGCEFGCTPAVPAIETCNLRDDDCDGMTDEGNPGSGASCGIATGACEFGTIQCIGGTLSCTGGVSPTTELCNNGDDDCDGGTDENNPEGGRVCGSSVGACISGRETCTAGALACVGAVGATPERCNAIDDNCDGTVDDGNPEGGASCGTNTGECTAGTLRCAGGGLSCTGAVGPQLDVCNMRDDDCDGVADQTFNTMTDPNNCGMCGRQCTLPNAISGCSAGACTFVACRAGFVNADGNTMNGCEYMCTPSGAETCNAADDDCDTRVDEALTPPAVCNPNGVCAGTTASCAGAGGWVCNYPAATYQATETRCDGLDNDCNGVRDEGYNIGAACNNGLLGTCRRTGAVACTSATASACNAATGITGTTETCNNLDDDCDGVLDDGVTGQWVPFTVGAATRYIMAYEASRPDSTSSSSGGASHRVCSEPGRMPWANITYPAAVAACTTLGARLCTEVEWQRACESSAPAATACIWSEATTCRTFNTLCNTNEFDANMSMAGDQDALMSTGALASCYTPWTISGTTRNVYDLSGNLQEWTAQRSAGVNPMRGGTYLDPMGGATCQNNFEVASSTVALPTVGFRCCRDTAP